MFVCLSRNRFKYSLGNPADSYFFNDLSTLSTSRNSRNSSLWSSLISVRIYAGIAGGLIGITNIPGCAGRIYGISLTSKYLSAVKISPRCPLLPPP